MNVRFELYVERELGEEMQELTIDIDADISEGCRGSRDSYGVPEEPDDPPHCEINSAKHNGVDFELTQEEFDAAWDKAWDKAWEVYNGE